MKKDKKDIIIKIILIIIIILLLIHNCALIKKKGKGKTPSGNINIIEIICEGNNNKCEEESSDNKKNIENNNDTGTNDDNNSSTGNANTGDKKTSTTDKNKNNSNNSSGTNSSGSNTNTNTDNDDEEDEDDGTMSVYDSNIKWSDTTELKIFENSIYNLNNIVAPEDSNTYQFVVKNSTTFDLNYDISFIESNPHHINMKYKLKKNNTYLVDHYVSFDELNISNQFLNAKKNDTFYLEWKWVSSDNDNDVSNGANYSLQIKVEAESV